MRSIYQDYHQSPMPSPQPFPNPQANPAGFLQSAIQQAKQIMQGAKDPRQLVLSQLGNLPPEIQHDPDQIVAYLQRNNMLNDEQRMLLSFLGR